jgi:hypothetical protein
MDYNNIRDMKVIETINFKKDIEAINKFIGVEIIQSTWQQTPIICEGREFIKWKDIIKNCFVKRPVLEIGYLDNETLFIKDTISINNVVHSTEHILSTMVFISKKVNSLINTSVDITFQYGLFETYTINRS